MLLLLITTLSIATVTSGKNFKDMKVKFVLQLCSLDFKGCDDENWAKTKANYDHCIASTYQQLQSFNDFKPEVCG